MAMHIPSPRNSTRNFPARNSLRYVVKRMPCQNRGATIETVGSLDLPFAGEVWACSFLSDLETVEVTLNDLFLPIDEFDLQMKRLVNAL